MMARPAVISPSTSTSSSHRRRRRVDIGSRVMPSAVRVGEALHQPGGRRLPKGHDAWVVGDEPAIVVDFFGVSNYAKEAEALVIGDRRRRGLASPPCGRSSSKDREDSACGLRPPRPGESGCAGCSIG